MVMQIKLGVVYDKYAYFYFYYYCFFIIIFFFAPLLLGISPCYSTREPFYLSGITC